MNQTKSGWTGVPWFWVSFPGRYNTAHFKKVGFEGPPGRGTGAASLPRRQRVRHRGVHHVSGAAEPALPCRLPLSEVVVKLGISDSIPALMVTYPTFLVSFRTWLLMGYFRTIPREVEECAQVDGASACRPS